MTVDRNISSTRLLTRKDRICNFTAVSLWMATRSTPSLFVLLWNRSLSSMVRLLSASSRYVFWVRSFFSLKNKVPVHCKRIGDCISMMKERAMRKPTFVSDVERMKRLDEFRRFDDVLEALFIYLLCPRWRQFPKMDEKYASLCK